MKKFIVKILFFLSLVFISIALSSVYVPNLSISNSLYYSILDKHNLLKNSKSPKMIFIGGSNLSFGLDSKRIVDTYDMNVINMGIHAGFGLKYIANDIKPFISNGDIVIIVPEYDHFYKGWGSFANGRTELLHIIMDIYPEGKKHIKMEQWFHLLRWFPQYGSKKLCNLLLYYLNTMFFERTDKEEVGIHHRKAFNEYGDAVIHWNLENRINLNLKNRKIVKEPRKKFIIDKRVIIFLNNFNKFVVNKGAKLSFLYPCYQETAYNKDISEISNLNKKLQLLNFQILSTPVRGKLEDKYFFDTKYHLNREGINLWTSKIIEDLKPLFYKD